jgi:hypothetical protein
MVKIPKVRNVENKAGNRVVNQFIIDTSEGEVFQSYDTVIAFRNNDGKIFLDPMYDCTRTTSRYRCQFLSEGIKVTRDKIDSGEYKVLNLNGE